jgi:hypothetical protein
MSVAPDPRSCDYRVADVGSPPNFATISAVVTCCGAGVCLRFATLGEVVKREFCSFSEVRAL